MFKKCLIFIATVTMLCAFLTGCGNSEEVATIEGDWLSVDHAGSIVFDSGVVTVNGEFEGEYSTTEKGGISLKFEDMLGPSIYYVSDESGDVSDVASNSIKGTYTIHDGCLVISDSKTGVDYVYIKDDSYHSVINKSYSNKSLNSDEEIEVFLAAGKDEDTGDFVSAIVPEENLSSLQDNLGKSEKLLDKKYLKYYTVLSNMAYPDGDISTQCNYLGLSDDKEFFYLYEVHTVAKNGYNHIEQIIVNEDCTKLYQASTEGKLEIWNGTFNFPYFAEVK